MPAAQFFDAVIEYLSVAAIIFLILVCVPFEFARRDSKKHRNRPPKFAVRRLAA